MLFSCKALIFTPNNNIWETLMEWCSVHIIHNFTTLYRDNTFLKQRFSLHILLDVYKTA